MSELFLEFEIPAGAAINPIYERGTGRQVGDVVVKDSGIVGLYINNPGDYSRINAESVKEIGRKLTERKLDEVGYFLISKSLEREE
jgi:hypothetical protein